MRLFSDDGAVIRIGREYLLIMAVFFVVHGGLNIFNGALRGAGDTLFPMAVSIICLWLIRIPLAYGFSSLWGRSGIWWAIGCSLCIGLVIIFIYYRLGYWLGKSAIRKNVK